MTPRFRLTEPASQDIEQIADLHDKASEVRSFKQQDNNRPMSLFES